MRITVSMLEASGACRNQVLRFRRLFGDSASLTRSNWRKAAAGGLTLLWVSRLLPFGHPLRVACNVQIREISEKYNTGARDAHLQFLAECDAVWQKFREHTFLARYRVAFDRGLRDAEHRQSRALRRLAAERTRAYNAELYQMLRAYADSLPDTVRIRQGPSTYPSLPVRIKV